MMRRQNNKKDMTYIGTNDSETRRLQEEFWAASAEAIVVSTNTVKT